MMATFDRSGRNSALALLVLFTTASAQAQYAQRTITSPIRNPNAAIGSIHENMTGRYVGMGQQVINHTPDIAAGVYWNMYNRNQAWLESNYKNSMGPMMINPEVYENLEAQRRLRMQAEAQRLAEQTQEIKQRQQIRPPGSSNPGATSTFYPGSDLLGATGYVQAPVVGGYSYGFVGPRATDYTYGAGYAGSPYYYGYGPMNGSGYGYAVPTIPGYAYGPVAGYGYVFPTAIPAGTPDSPR